MAKIDKIDKVYLVPHSHYDVVWIFSKEDYAFINCDLIIRKALKIIEEDEDYRFIIEQVYLIDKLKREYPDLWPLLCKRINDGKIEIVDGQYLMSDLNIPSGEVIVRNILIGKKYVKENFGKDVVTAWSSDAFGQNSQMPQIYKESGYKWVAFRRGMSTYGPTDFIWEGLDGSQIIADWLPLGYRAALDFEDIFENFNKIKEISPTNKVLMPSGSGVTIPQEKTGGFIKEWNEDHEDIKIRIATPKDFFEEIEKDKDSLEVIKDEFLSGKYSEVFPGTYSSRMWVKILERKMERLICNAEKFATIAWLFGAHYPKESLDEEWKRLFLVSFHDVISGCGVDDVYPEIKNNFLHSKKTLNRITYSSLKCISRNIKNDGNKNIKNIAVFNPLSWDVTNCVEIELKFEKGTARWIRLMDDEREIPYQITARRRYPDRSIEWINIVFVAENVPSLGYKVFTIEPAEERKKFETDLKVRNHSIENSFYKITFDQINGTVKNIYDKVNEKEIMGESNELYLESDIGDLYYHIYNEAVKVYKNETSTEGKKYGEFKVRKFYVTERGPVRARILIKSEYYPLRWPYRQLQKRKPLIYRYKKIDIKKEITIYNNMDRIEFRTWIDNRYPHCRIRVKFNTKVKNDRYVAETQFGAYERKTNEFYRKKKREWKEKPNGIYPAQNWIDYGDENGGICVINDGIPEHEVRDESIYLTLLRSVDNLSSTEAGAAIPTMDALEFRPYEFRYALYPHEGNWRDAKCFKQAYEFDYNLLPIEIDGNDGFLPKEYSFLKLQPDNLILSALKKAEDGDGIIARFFETSGKSVKGEIEFFKELEKIDLVNLLEKFKEKLGDGEVVNLDVDKFKIMTLKFLLKE